MLLLIYWKNGVPDIIDYFKFLSIQEMPFCTSCYIFFLQKVLAKLINFSIIIFVAKIILTLQYAGIAQSVEHFTRNEGVVGSSPISSLQKKERF